MAGHSKWSTIKRAKAVTDARRSAVFTKVGNIITIAAREKGGDPESNSSLRMAIEKAKAVNMPKDNIERAIKRGTGELGEGIIEELYYEGVLPGNIQVLIKSLTDNKNRSASVVRHALSKQGGSLAPVKWNFEAKGEIVILKEEVEEKKINLEELELELIEADIEDFLYQEELLIITKVENLHKTKEILENKGLNIESAEIIYLAKDKQEISSETKERLESFTEALDDLEDVSDYYFNVDL